MLCGEAQRQSFSWLGGKSCLGHIAALGLDEGAKYLLSTHTHTHTVCTMAGPRGGHIPTHSVPHSTSHEGRSLAAIKPAPQCHGHTFPNSFPSAQESGTRFYPPRASSSMTRSPHPPHHHFLELPAFNCSRGSLLLPNRRADTFRAFFSADVEPFFSR